MTQRILIAGGGIGGLTTALCCVHAGFDVKVFERAAALSEIGAGIQIGPNAARVMLELGLGPEFERVASRPPKQEMRLGTHNVRIFQSPLGDTAIDRYGAPYYLLHRTDLIELLGDALEQRSPGALHLGATVAGYSSGENRAALRMVDDSEHVGDVVIAADGIHSVLRDQMLGDDKPRFTGNIVWRALVPSSAKLKKLVPDSMCIWVGPERHCVTYWLRGGSILNFVGAVERDHWTKESWVEPGPIGDLKEDFGSWSTPIAAVVDSADECTRGALFDRDPLPRLTEGRVALIGDAAHPMLPFLAQGAAMAVEDAWTLATSLRGLPTDPAAALKRYEKTRLPRTSKVQMAARARMHSNHETTMLRQVKTYAPMWFTSRLRPERFDQRHQWLFSHDVTSG